jgi:integrase/recombinase XerC
MTQLTHSSGVQIGSFSAPDRDLIEALLEDKRSAATRTAYKKDLADFFRFATNAEPTGALVEEFLALPQAQALQIGMSYKESLRRRNLKEATVNRRLAALKSLVSFARKLGKTALSLQDLKGDKVVAYRDTTGVSPADYRKILDEPNPTTLKGKRDRAILRLLWDNALRRGEIARLDVGDFDRAGQRLRIFGKGRGSQAEWIDLAAPTAEAIERWLESRGYPPENSPLFTNLDRANGGTRLSASSIYSVVERASIDAGIPKHMSPHRVRHSAITAALDATDGNVREVQRLSRHKNLETLTRYDDNRQGHQRKVSELLSKLV